MDNERKHIIISEIKYWKQSKLLPDHYCDFLIALYSRGEEMNIEDVKATMSVLSDTKRKLNKTIMYLILLATFCTVSLLVIDNYSAVVLGISAFVLLSLVVYALRPAAKKSGVIPLVNIAGAFILLAMSLRFWIMYFGGQVTVLIALLFINCALWLIMGKYLDIIYLKISGVVGILLVVGFVVVQF